MLLCLGVVELLFDGGGGKRWSEWRWRRSAGCQRWNPSTIAGVWTSVWGSHMLSEFDQPTNLTRYHNLPHLNLESRIFLTLYSSWSLMVIGLGCRGCGHSSISSGT